MNAVSTALKAVFILCFCVKSAVMVRKTGATPSGFINARKPVNAYNPNVNTSFIFH